MNSAPVVDETTSVEDIEKLLPQNELDELDAIGDTRDDQRWKLGDKAHDWIDVRGLPVHQICRIIGKRADYGDERIRQFLYTSRFYAQMPELRHRYSILRYSIFEHARGCSEPEVVLKAALENRLSVKQVKFTYPQIMDELKEVVSRIPKQYEQEAKTLIEILLAKLKELVQR